MLQKTTKTSNPNFSLTLAPSNVFNGKKSLDFERIKHSIYDEGVDAQQLARICSASVEVRSSDICYLARHLLQCHTSAKVIDAVEILLKSNLVKDEVDLLPTRSLHGDEFGVKLLSYIEKRAENVLDKENLSADEQNSQSNEALVLDEDVMSLATNTNTYVNKSENSFNGKDDIMEDEKGDEEKKSDQLEAKKRGARASSEESFMEQVIQKTTSSPQGKRKSNYSNAIAETSLLRLSMSKICQTKNILINGADYDVLSNIEVKSKVNKEEGLRENKKEKLADEPSKVFVTEFEQQNQVVKSALSLSNSASTPKTRSRSLSVASETSEESTYSDTSPKEMPSLLIDQPAVTRKRFIKILERFERMSSKLAFFCSYCVQVVNASQVSSRKTFNSSKETFYCCPMCCSVDCWPLRFCADCKKPVVIKNYRTLKLEVFCPSCTVDTLEQSLSNTMGQLILFSGEDASSKEILDLKDCIMDDMNESFDRFVTWVNQKYDNFERSGDSKRRRRQLEPHTYVPPTACAKLERTIPNFSFHNLTFYAEDVKMDKNELYFNLADGDKGMKLKDSWYEKFPSSLETLATKIRSYVQCAVTNNPSLRQELKVYIRSSFDNFVEYQASNEKLSWYFNNILFRAVEYHREPLQPISNVSFSWKRLEWHRDKKGGLVCIYGLKGESFNLIKSSFNNNNGEMVVLNDSQSYCAIDHLTKVNFELFRQGINNMSPSDAVQRQCLDSFLLQDLEGKGLATNVFHVTPGKFVIFPARYLYHAAIVKCLEERDILIFFDIFRQGK